MSPKCQIAWPRAAFGLAVIAILMVLLCGCGGGEPAEPAEVTFLEATSEPQTSDFDTSKLTAPGRVQVYADAKKIFHDFSTYTGYQNVGNLAGVIGGYLEPEFYWYGYEATRAQETITLVCTPNSSEGKVPLLTMTSSYGDQRVIIYESVVADDVRGLSLSPAYTVEIFDREDFAKAVGEGKIPYDVVNFDTPPDADYIVKACVKLTFSAKGKQLSTTPPLSEAGDFLPHLAMRSAKCYNERDFHVKSALYGRRFYEPTDYPRTAAPSPAQPRPRYQGWYRAR